MHTDYLIFYRHFGCYWPYFPVVFVEPNKDALITSFFYGHFGCYWPYFPVVSVEK